MAEQSNQVQFQSEEVVNISEIPQNSVEIVKNKLYFLNINKQPLLSERDQFFTTDSTLRYKSFGLDFGPLNIGYVYRFCTMIDNLIQEHQNDNERFFYFSSFDQEKRANAIFLIVSYMTLFQNKTSQEAFEPFE
ncbi:MAG: putative dual specificity protein phosphatase CDC14A [Streblomastix strix]|uniref:Putative dual specificity protein phosphatase CDC14A n=1 Tax=Streblomastix strix TaxID=222440 RepID=A0A5J4TUQ8_9EUKA|nr:MAG: putative dual specificity protein phosphatase CDC14A [Streblomastix strix]